MWAAWLTFDEIVCGTRIEDVYDCLSDENLWNRSQRAQIALATIDLWMRHGTLVYVPE